MGACRFNPRTPCGVRQVCEGRFKVPGEFQSTHSLRSATALADLDMVHMWVSIHALLAECDCFRFSGGVDNGGFNPRTPCGVRRVTFQHTADSSPFQSTHSLRSATSSSLVQRTLAIVSIHALLAECDSDTVSAKRTRDSFNPRTPCGVRRHPGETVGR